jgi:hypothetical protein
MYAILLPSGAGIMVLESVYTRFTRVTFFGMGELVFRPRPLGPKRQGLSTGLIRESGHRFRV